MLRLVCKDYTLFNKIVVVLIPSHSATKWRMWCGDSCPSTLTRWYLQGFWSAKFLILIDCDIYISSDPQNYTWGIYINWVQLQEHQSRKQNKPFIIWGQIRSLYIAFVQGTVSVHVQNTSTYYDQPSVNCNISWNIIFAKSLMRIWLSKLFVCQMISWTREVWLQFYVQPIWLPGLLVQMMKYRQRDRYNRSKRFVTHPRQTNSILCAVSVLSPAKYQSTTKFQRQLCPHAFLVISKHIHLFEALMVTIIHYNGDHRKLTWKFAGLVGSPCLFRLLLMLIIISLIRHRT